MDDFNGKDNDDIPWGKYTYSLEGLAKECYLEGAVNVDLAERPGAPAGKRLRFRVELPERCFILSIAIKLPNAPELALRALEDVCIERTLRSAEYEMIHDGVLSAPIVPPQALDGDSPTAVDATAQSTPHNHRKKVLEIRRAADSLRITLADIDPPPNDDKMRDVTDSESDSDGHKTGEIRKLGVAVVGYVRGQTPVASRIKILLASSTSLGTTGSLADRAEIDGLLGLAFLGNKRYRQAGELLERASNGTRQVAIADQKKGFAGELGFTWAAELNLLAAHAYFEHEPRANDGIARLVAVVTTTKPRASTSLIDVSARNEPSEFLDLRTELLRITQPLMEKLVEFLGESSSLAVQMASARMIEFVGQQLGCAIAPYIGKVLDQVLSAYPECKPLGARERAAAASFSYDSMEDCYEKLVDICCRLLPLTEHSVLQRILEHTLMPVLHEAFDESKYLVESDNVEDEADDLLCTAVSQTLRLIYLVLTILGGDANVPPSFITKLLDMLIADDGRSRTPMLLRRSALHTWDAMTRSVIQSSNKKSVKDFKEYITVQVSYLSVMIVSRRRRPFEYQDGEDTEAGYEVRSLRMKKSMELSKALTSLLEKQRERVVIVDRHTLTRLLNFMTESFVVLVPMSDEDERHTASTALSRLLRVLNESSADLFLSTLMDIGYFTAVSCNMGPSSNLDYIGYGTFSSHMKACLQVFETLLNCYWAAIRLLPSKIAEETENKFLVRSLLSWCVMKMKETAPPRDMLRLILIVVRGFQNESSCTFKQEYDFPSEVSPLDLFRANNLWLAHATHFESLDLFDLLCPIVGRHLMAKDILDAINGLGEQDDILDGRAYLSADVLASIVAKTIPADPDATKRSLAEVVDHTVDEPRIVDGFPKSSYNRSSSSMISRKLRFASTQAADHDPMIGSLYIHIVLASCFDKFDSLDKAGKRKGGGLCMGNYLDSFIEHAAFLVKCLVQCAKERKHREYIRHALGEIFRSCLNMQNHGDGRVRLAGFEIFASSLNVLFLTESAAQRAEAMAPETLALGATVERTSSISLMSSVTAAAADPSVGSVKELGPTSDIADPKSPSTTPNGKMSESSEANKPSSNDTNQSTDDEERMYEIYTNGGSCTFYTSQSTSSDLTFEENAWHMLSTFMTSSLGIGKYSDFVVHRACLEYLRGCILNALRGKSTGASVISFLHVEPIWEAVLRLVGSPVHSLNGLALWVICATINVGVYSAVMAKGRGESRQRATALAEFVTNKLFVTAENFIKGGSKEMRLWGGRLLEVYIRARSMNSHSLDICPPPSRKVLLALQTLSTDWCEEARVLAKSLLSMHLEIPTKKPTTPSSSFTDRASTFLTNRRFGGNSEQDDEPNSNSDSIKLWFPALPTVSSTAQMDRFGKTLEAFANAEVLGGEEADIVDSEEDRDDSEYEDESITYDEEEEVEYEENLARANSLDMVENQSPPETAQETTGEGSDEDGSDDDGDGGFPQPQVEPRPEELPETQVETSNDSVVPMDMEIVQAPPPPEPKETKEAAEPKKAKDEPFVSLPPKEPEKPKVEKVVPEKVKPEKSKTEKHKSEKSKPEKTTHAPSGEKQAKKPMPTFPGDRIEGVENDDLELEEIDDLDLGLGGLGATVVEDHEEEEIDLNDTGLERMPSLPRVGSFTGRKPQAVNAEGEGIRLERRKSVDVGSLWETNATRKRSDEDFDVNSRNRRAAFREVASMNDDRGFGSRETMPGSNSFKGSRGSPKEAQSQPGLLGLSSHRRVQRGVKLDDEEEMPSRQHQSSSSSSRPSIDELRRKFDNPNNRSSGSLSQSQPKSQSSSRRTLPRVPAFNKVQTRRPTGQGDKPGFESQPQPEGGSSGESRKRLPRTRSSSKGSFDSGRRGDRDRFQRSQSDFVDDDGSAPQVYRAASVDSSSRRRARRIGSDEFLPKDAGKDESR